MTEIELRLQKQIDDLEIKLSFQDHTVEELNDAVIQQQRALDRLNTQVGFLVSKMKSMEPANLASMDEEVPPPHY